MCTTYSFTKAIEYTKKNEVAAEHGGNAYKIVAGKSEGLSSQSGDLGVDWSIILNCKLEKQHANVD
jgi:hypothetical protein